MKPKVVAGGRGDHDGRRESGDREGGNRAQASGPDQPAGSERAAAVVAGLTAASRGVGLIRTVLATAVLGLTYLGNTYNSTNTTSTLLFDLFAGGALAAVVVPSMASVLATGERPALERTASALLNTALLCLTPVVLAGLVLRGPVMDALTSGVADPVIRSQERALGSFLLLAFLPQIWLYGIGLVTTGVLHVHHRFVGPALAPLLSSVVVGFSYLLYAWVEGPHARHLGQVSSAGRLILGLGTTAGVAVLTLAVLIPAGRLGLRWRPVLRIPAEARAMTRRLLGSALLAVALEQVLLGAMLIVANRVEGGVVAYMLAFTLLELPWAILAVPIAIAAFPRLAAAQAAGDTPGFQELSSTATRNLVVLTLGGAAVMLALAGPGTRLLLDLGIGGGRASARLLAPTVAAFAPGLLGYGGYALLTRVAYALGDGRSPALAALLGFGSATVLSVLAARAFSGRVLIAALAGAFSIGITLGAVLILMRLSARVGRQAFQGLARTGGRALAAGGLAALLGAVAARVLAAPAGTHLPGHVGLALGVAGLTVALYLGGLHLLGDRQLGAALAAVRSGAPLRAGHGTQP